MSQTCPPPCLFFSHSGADTDAARELKRRLLDSPDARAAGLRVWLDKDDLAAGLGWQAQLEKAISEEATAFAVHVGANGVMNWVESEVRLGLSRAAAVPDYPFIPILAKECPGSAALPSFARQYQGVRDPLNNPEEFVKLLRAVLRRSPGKKAVVLDSPFVGLKAMTEADADRFFGRNEEIDELVTMLKQHRLIAVVADSGAGKSSLALAGLIPHFRGGALSDTAGREPDGRLWHVVVMRPRRDPIEGLKRGVTEAAERLGRSTDQCAALRKRINASDPSETAYAIRCDLPVGTTETLLIVDQFEELLTETGEAQRASTVDLLMALEAIGGFRIVLTLRADHFNLCRPFSKLFEHLTRNSHEAVLRLRRITDAGLIEAARTPLHLAGHTDVSEQDAVIDSIRRDITDRAGDLALVQMALYAMWQKHRADGVNLLVAYSQVGGVVGALAHEAERVRTQRLDATERPLLAPLLIRLVRLGETGGATRRTADLADFDGPRHTLATRLATEDCGRLLVTGERTVEIAHEALITQWPWLQNTLNEAAADMRVLDRLIDRAHRWNTIGARSPGHLATGAERTEFSALAQRRSDWLSAAERDFVAASEEEAEARSSEQRKQLEAIAAAQAERETALHEAEDALKQAADAQRKRARIRNIALVVVSILAVLAGLLGWSTEQQRKLAEQQRITAEKQTEQADDILGRATNIIAKLQTKMDDETKNEAFALFQTGAKHGDRTSMRNLGISYDLSLGVTRDYAKAREWYEKAAAKDDATAMSNLGRLYASGQGVAQDYTKAREWYEKAVAKDDETAMTRLGVLYHNGLGVAQDFAKAREWYEKAAAKDDATAMSNLGLLYENGRGVAQDFAKAREWYEKAATKDDVTAQENLEKLSISEAAAAGRYADAFQLQEALAAKVEAAETRHEGKPGNETAGALNSTAWYALFAREFTKALTVADRARALLPDSLAIETNRAHALLFLGREEEARTLYLAYKGKPVPEQDDRLWERVIVEDFAELRKTGLTHRIMADIEKELGVSP